jgi:DNA-binding NarL/FixJ family response regulator
MPIRLLIADDHKLMREGLRALLSGESDIEVIGEASNGRAIVKMVEASAPDIVLMDISMPQLNGIDATRQIKDLSGTTRVIALSMHADRLFVQGVLKAGAAGYILKDSAFDELAQAVRAVSNGQMYLSPGVAGVVVEGFLKTNGAPADNEVSLTAREREVLQLITEGITTRDIATQLHISVKTVETHRRQLMKKLDIYTVAELTKYAIRNGLTRLE